MPNKETIAALVVNRLPEFVHDDYPVFVEFMQAYFGWLEEDENFIRVLLDFKNNKDVSNESDAYVDQILTSLGFDSSMDLSIQKNRLVLFLRDYYLSRGSEDSFKFLFRLFFNKNVEIDYPRRKMATTSNSVYANRTNIYITADNRLDRKFRQVVDNPSAHASSTVEGLKSGVMTTVERIVEYAVAGRSFLEINIIKPNVAFQVGEPIRVTYDTINFTETSLAVGDVVASPGGKEYQVGDLIKVSHPASIRDGVYRVRKITPSSVESVTITDGGTAYTIGDMVFAEQMQRGAGFSAEVSEISESGAIVSLAILNRGWGYRTIPNLVVTSLNGTGAIITAVSSTIGGIAEIEALHPIVFDEGTSITAVTISSVRGTGATLSVVARSAFTTSKKNEQPIDGVLGRNCVLTDSNLFQQFSYEVISEEASVSHKPVSDMCHPVGYMRFNVLNLRSSEAVLLLNDPATRFRYLIAIPPQTVLDMPLPGTTFVQATQLKLAKILYEAGILRPAVLSINTMDRFKFSPNFGHLPLSLNYPVINYLNQNAFVHEALDAEITLNAV